MALGKSVLRQASTSSKRRVRDQKRRRLFLETLETRRVLATLTGAVWDDVDGDGLRDVADHGLAGVSVYVDSNNDGVRDAGEPTTVTVADDPSTTSIDEAGTYSLSGLATGQVDVRIDIAGNFRASSPLTAADGTLPLELFENLPVPTGISGSSPIDIDVSPNGNVAVVGWGTSSRVSSFYRNPIDGSLSHIGEIYNPNLNGITDVTFHPNGKFVYVAARVADAINVMSVAPNGALSWVDAETFSDNSDLDQVRSLVVTPDGSQLVAVAPQAQSMLVYDINSVNGTLTLAQTVKQGVDGVTNLPGPAKIAISPDGSLIAVTNYTGNNDLQFFDRDVATGALSPGQTAIDFNNSYFTIYQVAFSADGKNLYIADSSNFIRTLDRDPTTGGVTLAGSTDLGALSPEFLVTSPDGSSVFVTAPGSDAMIHLSRDSTDGSLTIQQTFLNTTDVSLLDAPQGITVSPDGRNVYAVATTGKRLINFSIDQAGRSASSRLVELVAGETAADVNFSTTIDSPMVTSFASILSGPIDATTVDFQVQFSEPVTGVDVSAFQFHQTTFTNASIDAVTGSGANWTVTVSTPTGQGFLQLELVDNNLIRDADSAALGGAGTGSVVARSNRILVDSVPPNVLAIAPFSNTSAGATEIDFYVSFDEPVTGLDVGDLSTTDTGAVVSTVLSVTPTSDPQVFVATIGVTGIPGTVALNLTDDDSIVDAGLKALGGIGTSGPGNGSFVSSVVVIDTPAIRGTIWSDANQNGRRDVEESGLADAIIFADLNDNGLRDAAEPMAVSIADNLSTTGVDESGQYTISGLAATTTYSILIDNAIHTQTNPVAFSQDDGLLTYKDDFIAKAQPDISLLSAETVIASDDGRHLYTTSLNGHTLGVFERDFSNDTFTRVQSIRSTTAGFAGLNFPRHFELTPDGRFGYLGSSATIYVVSRDQATGLLTFASKLNPGDAGPSGQTGSTSFVASPDSRWLYASGPSAGFSVFAIDQSDGSLALTQQFVSGENGASGLNSVANVAVTPDGSQVFVTTDPDRELQIYDVIPGTGRLVLTQTFTTVYNSEDTAFSPDGNFAYVAETDFSYIRLYQRDPLTGTWNYLSRTQYSSGDASGIDISTDGRFIYLANEVTHSITVLQRNETTGALTAVQTLLDEAPHSALSGVRQVIVTPDDQEVFAVSYNDGALTRFGRVSGTTSVVARDITTNFVNNNGGDFGVFNSPPTVVSLLADGPNPTGADTATFTLTFDESVSGVDLTDFSLVETGITGSTIASVTGGPAQYTVTVNTGTSQGTVQLILDDDDSIVDLGGQPLAGTGDNGSTGSALLSVNKTPPVVSSITGTTPLQTTASTVSFAVAFSKPVTGVDAGDFALDVTGLTTPALVSVTESTPSLYLVEVSTGPGEGTLQLNLVDNSTITDLDSIGLLSGFGDGDTYTIDRTDPTSVSLAPATESRSGDFEVRFVATFSESVSGLDTSDFSLTSTGLVGAEIIGVEGSGATYNVIVTTGDGVGTVGVSLIDDDSVTDGAGNPLGGPGAGNSNVSSPLHTTLRSTPFVISPTTFVDELDGDTTSLAALRSSPGGSGISLREVIVAANQSPERVHVNLSAGTYTLSISGSREDVGLSGDLDITEDLTIIGVASETVIDASGLGDRAIDLGYYTALHMHGVTVTGGTASGATATGDYRGGGLRSDFGTALYLDQVNFHDNTAISSNSGSGGALDLFGTTTIVHSTFKNNESKNDGGAIATAGSQGTLTILASTFDGNNGPGGGAIYSVQSLLIQDSLFTGNNATLPTPNGSNGGAINANAGSSVTITNSTFTGHVSGFGGAMYLTGDANISNSTIVNNSSPNWGGGIYFGGSASKTLQIGNSIIAGNTSVNGGPNVYGTLTSLGGNLVVGTSGSTGFGVSGDIFPSDAMLESLSDNGGPTMTHLPLAGSPAIDAGSNAIATDRDARGIARPQGTAVDIGAVELFVGSNQAPTAADDSVSTSEDTAITFDARTGDTDLEGDTLSVTLLQSPRYGVATVGGDQLVTYTPSTDFSGSDKLVYQITDHAGDVDLATVIISVSPQNDAPKTVDDAIEAVRETSTIIAVLANDSDVEGDPFTIESFTQPTSGVVTDNGDGTLAYTGNTGFIGTDTFTYTATDGNDVSASATVTVNVSAIPVANDDWFNVEESGELRFFAFLNNTSLIMNSDSGDWIGQGLSYDFDASNSGISVSYNRVTSSNSPDQWRIGVDVNNYTGASGFAGDNFDMDFVAKEGDEITVGSYTGATRWPFNDPANPGIDISATGRGCNTILGDFDIDALDLRTSGRVARLEMSFQQQCGANITPTSPGLTGTLVYSSPSYAHSILTNDVDDDSDALSAVLETGPNHGTLELRSDGSVIYVADTGYTGPDLFTYRAVDPLGLLSAPATVSLSVTGINEAPVVTAITPLDSTNTSGTSVRYQLDFNEPVYLAQSSLNLVTTGLTGATIDSIQTNGSRASYIVTIDAGSGNGTAQLQVIDDNITKDFAELPLGGPSAGDGNFTSAATYNIETNPLRDIIGDVYIDANLNGGRDAGELGAGGQSVYIDANDNQTLDAGETIAITDAAGHYVLADQPLGTYTVAVADQPGWFTTAASTGSATLVYSGGDVTLDMGIEENLTQISGLVYRDDDANGMWSGTEVGLGEWVIFLDANQNGQLDTGETSVLSQRDDPNTPGVDETGYYSFADLPIGDHYVTIVPQTNVHATTPTMGWVTIADSNDVGLVDFGMYPLDTRISGVLFEDTNLSGTLDSGEAALSGFTVYLDANANGVFDSGETSVVTTADDPGTLADDETGRFEFIDLDEGNHLVAVVGQPGHLFLNPISLVLGFGSEPLEIELPIEANLTEISGTVFDDIDSDGIRQAGESGLAGWLVFVDLNSNGSYNAGEPYMHTLADDANTAGVDELGTFSFTNLDLGNYSVAVQPPTGFLITGSASFAGTLASSTDQFSGDFGAHFNGADVGGILFDDLNGDGFQDTGELPLAGLVVFADYNGDGAAGASEPSDTTAADGSYLLANVIAGETAISIITTEPQIVTSDVAPIPRLFVEYGQGIRELNPRDGSVLNYLSVNVSPTHGVELSGLAFDGTNLYAMDSFLDVVLVIDPNNDGTLSTNILYTLDLNNQSNQSITGLAVIGTTLYALDENTDTILTYDLATNTLGASFNIQALNVSTTHHPGGFNLNSGLGESADGTQLAVSTTDQYRLYIDPATGLITGSDVGLNVNDVGSGLAGASNRIYSGRSNAYGIKVHDTAGGFLTQLGYYGTAESLAAGPSGRVGTLLTVVADQDVTELDMGLASSVGSITGTQFTDANGNGVFDTGELPVAGVTVFVDTNGNFWPDAGEPQATSGIDGTYTITGVAPGPQTVRAIAPEHYRVGDAYAAEDRLYVAYGGSNLGGGFYHLMIRQIDPIDGSVLATIPTTIPIRFGMEITFHGNSFIVVDNWNDQVHEVAMDGELIETVPLGDSDGEGGFFTAEDYGATVIGNSIISVRKIGGDLFLMQYDREGNQFSARRPVSITPSSIGLVAPSVWTTGVGRSADGQSIVISGDNSAVALTIDVATGEGILSREQFTDVDARDSLGGEMFLAFDGSPISVIDSTGNINRTLSIPAYPFGIGTGVFRDNGLQVSVTAGETQTALDHGFNSMLSTVSGTVTEGTAFQGAQVYIDVNGNGQFDLAEPNATTGADGTYTITDVVAGEHIVRQVELSGRTTIVAGSDVTRLFVYTSNNQLDSTIAEIDTETGVTLQEIAAPGPANQATGMAVEGGKIFLSKNASMFVVDAATGQMIDEIPIPSGVHKGLAILDSVAYLHDSSTGTLKTFDLQTRRVTNSIQLNGLIPGYSQSGLGGLGESPDGQSLIITAGTYAYQIDPVTGSVIADLGQIYPGVGIASAGGLLFEPHQFSGSLMLSIAVRDQTGQLIRSIPVQITNSVQALGAESVAASAHRISVYGGDNFANLDFDNVADTGTISGMQFIDSNANGIVDAGEVPQAGVVVFVDDNANGFPDAGESQTISQADGSYVLTDVPTGNSLVRTITPANHRPTVVSYSADRLFATGRITDGNSPTGYIMDVREIDPATGNVMTVAHTDLPISYSHSTAFDGQQLIVIDNTLDSLFKIGLDGTLIETVPLPWVGNDILFVNGPVMARGAIYVLASSGEQQWIYRFDTESNQFVEPKALTLLLPAGDTPPQFSTSLSESVDGQSIIAYASDQRAFTIDPATGRTTSVVELAETQGFDYAATAVGQELFVGSSGSSGTLVYNDAWVLQRTMTTNFTRQGFGGGLYEDSGLVVSVSSGQTTADVSFGYRSTLGTISGTILDDVNSDGISDVGDQPRVGVDVFLDSNRNGVLDAGEVFVTTDAAGTYTFTGITPGDHQVQVVTTSDERSVTTAGQATRLFTTQSGSGVGPTVIRELDPISGAVLNTFDAPEDVGNAGLALDQHALYFATQDDLYSLDPDTGEVFAYLELPNGDYTGAAAVGGHVFVVEPNTNKILKIEPLSQTVVATFTSTFDLTGTLGESFDGTKLIASTANNGVVAIDPVDGSEDSNVNFLWMDAGSGAAAGEHYHGSQGKIQIRNQQNQLTRTLPTAYHPSYASGLAVAEVPHREARLNMAADATISGVDFLIRSGLATSDIELSATSINENIDTSAADVMFAELSAVDASPIGQYFFSLAIGNGDDDNEKFVIVGNELRIKQNEVIDYETQPTYQVRVFVGDNSQVLMEKELTLSVNNLIEMSTNGPSGNGITIANGTSQRSRVDSVTVEFDSAVTVEPGAFEIVNLTDPTQIVSVTLAPASTSTAAVLSFAGSSVDAFGSLKDGNYRLIIHESLIHDGAGNYLDANHDGETDGQMTDDFFRLYGDRDGNREVGYVDFLYFRGSYGSSSTSDENLSAFDLNTNGIVDYYDYLFFRGSYGKKILP
ncbi:SdrD B-like domain-containing protein [Rubripirellula reticaptiva]|uniref:Serine-aspartate repeat-containing protein D n=1 Tax=Rubripirellula reticaptiva TaxID=2528013 RepID=A0A5C6EFB5_9BACT|nr:SdrD B-like domain-containing protein [Rubripirellula reticaptiva]TWU47692.1 Serine-aspartate repeat-containing protein D precursor [Rubripirellula reticaptiva]